MDKITGKRKMKIKDEFVFDEFNASNAPVKNVKWHGGTIDTSSKLEDPGQGSPVVIKRFLFFFPPVKHRSLVPSKNKLLEHHRAKIIDFLWKDNLELREDIKPLKLVVDAKKGQFSIFAVCMFKKGVLVPRQVTESLQPLQDIVSSGNQIKI